MNGVPLAWQNVSGIFFEEEALLKRNTCDSIQGHAVLVMLYHAVQRDGEVSTSNWDTVLWEQCQGGRFYLDWGKTKKGAKHSFLSFRMPKACQEFA